MVSVTVLLQDVREGRATVKTLNKKKKEKKGGLGRVKTYKKKRTKRSVFPFSFVN